MCDAQGQIPAEVSLDEGCLPSSEIEVGLYDLILIWPIFIEDLNESRANGNATRALAEMVEEIKNHPGSKWKPREIRAPYPARKGDWAEAEYAEFVYFHTFVRNFLYTTWHDLDHFASTSTDEGEIDRAPNRNLRVLEQDDLNGCRLEVEFFLANKTQAGSVTVGLQLRQVQLHLFDTRIAMLALKLDYSDLTASEGAPDRFTLQTVLKMQDVIRRIYAPYWQNQPWGQHQAGHCPDALRLIKKDGTAVLTSHFGTFDTTGQTQPNPAEVCAARKHREKVCDDREPYTTTLWRELIKPIKPVARNDSFDPKGCNLRFEHVEDERLVLLSYIGADNPRKITTGDWMRLANVEDPGDSNRYPYSPLFQDESNFRESFCYDRFWCKDGGPPSQEIYTTRWLCSGYSFTGVGSASDTSFFADQFAGGWAHFRHHYFKLALIAHFHRASLLNFKRRIAEAVEALREEPVEEKAERGFQSRLIRIEKDFVTFRAMYWFTEVSNQIQGRELFHRFSKHLSTREIFERVSGEIHQAAQIVAGWNRDRQNELVTWLTVLAAGFLIITPMYYTFLTGVYWWPSHGVGAVLTSLGGLLAIVLFLRPLERHIHRIIRSVDEKRSVKGILFLLLVALAIAVGGIWCTQHLPAPNGPGTTPIAVLPPNTPGQPPNIPAQPPKTQAQPPNIPAQAPNTPTQAKLPVTAPAPKKGHTTPGVP